MVRARLTFSKVRAMSEKIEPLIEDSIEIDAAPSRVWALVSDLPRMASWSPQVVRTVVLGGAVRRGSLTINLTRRGPLFWPTQAKVVRFDRDREFAFRVVENRAIWSFTLEPTETGGTRLTERRELPEGLSGLSKTLTRYVLGGQEVFTSELRAGIRQTLERVKAEAEE